MHYIKGEHSTILIRQYLIAYLLLLRHKYNSKQAVDLYYSLKINKFYVYFINFVFEDL